MSKRFPIFKKDGTKTPFFWSDRDGANKEHQTVYKRTEDGIKRMTGVYYDVKKNEFVKQS